MPPQSVTIRNGEDSPDADSAHRVLEPAPAAASTGSDGGPVGLVLIDGEGVITFENDDVRALLGEEPSAPWVGRPLTEVDELPPAVADVAERVLNDATSYPTVAISLAGEEPSTRTLNLRAAPIRAPGGEVTGAALTLIDRRSEAPHGEELRVRRLYDHTASLLQNAALALNSEHAFLDEAVALLGQAAQADQVFILLSAEDADAYEEEVRWAKEPERSLVPLRMEISGSEFGDALASGVVHLNRLAMPSEQDAAIEHQLLIAINAAEALAIPFLTLAERRGVLLLARTRGSSPWSGLERRAIERVGALFETLLAWMRAEQRYRDAISAIDDALAAYSFGPSRERTFSLLTRQIRNVIGHDEADLLAGTVAWSRDVVYPEDNAAVEAFEHRLRAGKKARLTYRVRHVDGQIRWVRESAAARRDSSGRMAVASILSDVTDQKDAEDALVWAKREAESAARVKSAFLATMSHELRTPLGAIKGFADLLCDEVQSAEGVPDEITEFAEVIRANAARVLGLIGDLIDLACLQTDGLPIEQAPVALGPLLEDLARRYTPQLRERGLELVMQDRSAEFLARADQRRLEQVLDIILSNAAKFTEQGRIEVELSSGEDAICITVSDTGIGIGEESLDRVFEPFYQEDNRLNRAFEGSGLGLSLAQRLLAAMNGEIGIRRREGGGTAVTVRLPRADG